MELKTIFSIVLFAAVLLLNRNSFIKAVPMIGRHPCPTLSSPTEEWPLPTNCNYGVTRDICGRNVCAKGPGERCEILRFQVRGNCGDGMYCSCSRCMGCSSHTFRCFEQICVIPYHS